MANPVPYKPMYKVRPYFVVKKVKLPDCMYLVRPLYKLPSVAGDERGDQAETVATLSYLEEKEEKLSARIKQLKQNVLAASKRVGLEPAELQTLVENHVPDGIPLDVVINCSPSDPPYLLLTLFNYISAKTVCSLKSFVHSSAVGAINRALPSMFNKASSVVGKEPKLKITVIWKSASICPQPSLMVAPQSHTPIQGLANICRFLCRMFCPELYEDLGNDTASQIDSWMDSMSLSFAHGNAKEKTSVLRHMNSSLGSAAFLCSSSPTAADVVVYSALAPREGLKIGGNVKSWMRRCHSLSQMSSVPCVYLAES